jgi:integrase
MTIKFDTERKSWTAGVSKRNPNTGIPASLKRIGLKSKAEAIRTKMELERKLDASFLEKSSPSWGKVFSEYIDFKRTGDWNEKSYQNCKVCLDAHTIPFWGKRRIDLISTKDIRLLLNERVGHSSASTQQTVLKYIRGVFQYAVENGYVSKNPAPNIRFRIGEKIKNVLTFEQAKVLLEKAKEYNSEWYFHWALALYTGMRNGELYSLTWDKVDLENRKILVDSSWNKVCGFKSTKSGNDRIVEIAPVLVTVLKELKLKQFDSAFVLPRSRNWEKGEQARMLRMFLQGIGLPSIRFHDLRASWATMMLSMGVEPIKVMNMGGWTQLKTMQIYIRKAGVDIKGITDKLNLHDPAMKSGEVIPFRPVESR